MKNILGVSAGSHDAAVSVIDDQGNILFASQSERYSKKKNDHEINYRLIEQLQQFDIDIIAYYENPLKHKLQKFFSGQGLRGPFGLSSTLGQHLGDYYYNMLKPGLMPVADVPSFFQLNPGIVSFSHHMSHAAAGFQTSPFHRATVVVIDAIGEFDTATIWGAEYDHQGQARYTQLWRQRYPHSIGLFYSAVTKHIGLEPMEEEYITMGMAAYGDKQRWLNYISDSLIDDYVDTKFRDNLHAGLPDWFLYNAKDVDVAAAAQAVLEKLISNIMERARNFKWSDNLVYMGGVALNCLANRHLGKYFDRIWVMPAPGDAGSSLGAAALAYGKQIHWTNAYLGHDIAGDYPVRDILHELLYRPIVGVASGRAEFGPRALGNRSLLADPRGADIKDQVNEIKRRQKFRPFAPVILEEHVHQYFAMPCGWSDSRYMQVVADCRRPDLYPAVCHVDGTSRVQTVPQDGSGIRRLLEAWYDATGCPMLLNTSLNVRGEPMVNDLEDARRFEMLYNVKVCT